MKRLLALFFVFWSINIYAQGPINIVPAPIKVEIAKGSFRVKGAPIKCDPSIGPIALEAISRFASRINIICSGTSSVSSPIGLNEAVESGNIKGIIFLKDKTLKAEHYTIDITSKHVLVKANDTNAFIWATHSLMQMLPPEVFGSEMADLKLSLPCCHIEDGPRFAYRGMHLDCSRHFWEIDEIKRYIDVMSWFKLNRFHWHLSDDQGWRVEIKKYPLLNQVSCFRNGTMIAKDWGSSDNKRYGGYYSQSEIKEVVEYAIKRGITIVPEIDLPGHMLAAMAAYPWLGCSGGPYEVWTQWGVSEQVLCVGKESTFSFLEDVLSEIASLFPGEYIHIGGDECPKGEWEKCPDCQAKIRELGLKSDENASAEQYLQNYVTARIQNFLATKGKKIIGWDEILEGELAEGATVMSWRGSTGGQLAAAKGFDVIMTPNSHLYFDYYQSEDIEKEPLGIGGYVSLEKVYSFKPLEGIASEHQGHVLGVQANLWTEYITETKHLEYMLLPRMLALCEVQWCDQSKLDFERFKTSLTEHCFKIFDAAGYSYAKHLLGINGIN